MSDKGEHTALYKINKSVTVKTSKILITLYKINKSVTVKTSKILITQS